MKKIEVPWRQPFSFLSSCVFDYFFFLSFSLPHSLSLFSLFLSLNSSKPPSLTPQPHHSPSFLSRLTPPEGDCLSVCLSLSLSFSLCPSITSRKKKAVLMTPSKQRLLDPNKWRHSTSFSLTCLPFLVQLSSFFRLPPSDKPDAAILHLHSICLLSYFFFFFKSFTHIRTNTHMQFWVFTNSSDFFSHFVFFH